MLKEIGTIVGAFCLLTAACNTVNEDDRIPYRSPRTIKCAGVYPYKWSYQVVEITSGYVEIYGLMQFNPNYVESTETIYRFQEKDFDVAPLYYTNPKTKEVWKVWCNRETTVVSIQRIFPTDLVSALNIWHIPADKCVVE